MARKLAGAKIDPMPVRRWSSVSMIGPGSAHADQAQQPGHGDVLLLGMLEHDLGGHGTGRDQFDGRAGLGREGDEAGTGLSGDHAGRLQGTSANETRMSPIAGWDGSRPT